MLLGRSGWDLQVKRACQLGWLVCPTRMHGRRRLGSGDSREHAAALEAERVRLVALPALPRDR